VRRTSGHTLLEVVVALAITAVIMTALATAVTTALRARAAATDALERATSARLAVTLLERELATALPDGFSVTAAPPALRFTGGADPGLRLAYELAGGALVRRAAPRFALDDGAARPIAFVPGVASLELRALDGDAWVPTWSAREPPRAVRIVLALAGGETIESVVPIPTGRERHA
jgi:general secretion pathway protein J